MKIRCDKAMRRSKERLREIKELGLPKWRCTGKCENCICGIVTGKDGTEHHVNLLRKERHDKVHNTTEADH